MKAHDLIHNGYYLLGETEIVRFYALNGGFYTLDGKWVGRVFVDALSGRMEVLVAEKEWKTISPIQLTPEILEKNGTCYCKPFYYNEEWDITLEVHKGCNGYYTYILGKLIHINYVHELQGALYLCGLNELAENFKV